LVSQGRYAEAAAAGLELLPRVEGEWGKTSLEAAEVLDNLTEALWRNGQGTEETTLEYAERALEVRRLLVGPDHPLVADSLVEKSLVLKIAGRPLEAQKPLLRALVIYRSAYRRDDRHVAMTLHNLGSLDYELARYQEAADHFEAAVGLYSALCGSDCIDVADGLVGLSNAVSALGDDGQAEALLRRAHAIYEAELGPSHLKVARTSHNLGLLLQGMGEYEESRRLTRRAIKIKEEALGPDHPDLATSVCNYAILLEELGEVAEAGSSYQRCVGIFERRLGSDHPDTVKARANYGSLLRVWDAVAARAEYERALAVTRNALGDDHPQTAWILAVLGDVVAELGDLDAAQSYLEKALGIWEDHPEAELSLQIGAVRGMGELHLARGELDQANRYLERALALELERHGPEHVHIAMVQSQIGELLVRQGLHGRAEAIFEQALELARRTLGEETIGAAEILVRRGDLRTATGDCQGALGDYRRAVSVLEAAYAGETLHTGEVRLKIAGCLSEMGATRPAAVAALQAESIGREHLRLMLTGMSESGGLRYASTRASGLDLAFSLLLSGADSEVARASVDALIRARALTLDEMAFRWQGLLREDEPKLAEPVARLAAARRRLAYLIVRGADSEELAGYTQVLREARAARETAERDLAVASRRFRSQEKQRQAGLNEVTAAMPAGALLVGFFRFRLLDFEHSGAEAMSEEQGRLSYLAFVLEPRAEIPEVVLLGSAEEIEDLVERVLANVEQESSGIGLGQSWSESVYRRDAELLRRRVWDPLRSYFGGSKTVFVVPDSALHLVNLAALPVDDASYLIERGPQIHYLSAERDLAVEPKRPEGKGLLALGNPAFDDRSLFAEYSGGGDLRLAQLAQPGTTVRRARRGRRSSCEGFDSMRFDELVHTTAEVSDLIELWERLPGSIGGVADLRGAGASESAFKAAAPGRRLLHLATHGFFIDENCGASQGGIGSRALLESPLLRSGLALAGANHRRAASLGEDDGVLTAEEIAVLDLTGVEWAVLSACKTGVGEIRDSEGVLGLRRAFKVAGVETLVMSLWEVEDEPTRQWMGRLYEYRFAEGLDTVDSVRRASLDLLQSRRESGLTTHPFYWAGFVAAGDWR
jgi:CHAT domain-containing protein/tetratricopeptide (TPR) repeat protein